MNKIDFFKLQAKNLHKDFKTQKSVFDEIINENLYEYSPKYFDVDQIIIDYDLDEDKAFSSLMKVQHLFATIIIGFKSWSDLINAPEIELELAKALFDNQHKISLDEWGMYIARLENENKISLDAEEKLEIFKKVFADVDGHRSSSLSYKL